MRTHYERIIVLCGFLIFFTDIGLPSTSFNVFQPYIAALPFAGNTGGSALLAMRTFVSLICMFFVARFIDALGARRGASLAALFTATGFFLYSLADSMFGLFLGALFTGAGYGLGGMVVVTLVTRRWFTTGVATAMGIATMGSGISSLALPPLVARIIEGTSLSWGFRFEAVVALAMAFIIFALLRDDPSDLGLEPYVAPEKPGHKRDSHAPRTTPLPRRVMMLLIVGIACMSCVCIDAYNYMSILFTSEGIDSLHAASLVAIMGAALTAAKFVSGRIIDRIGTFKGSVILFALMAIGLLCACFSSTNDLLPFAAVLLFGSGVTLGSVGISLWSMELATPETMTKTVKNLQVAYAFGGFVFSIVPGPLADLTGTYVSAYAIMLALTCISAVIVLSIYSRYRSQA